jgi:hypothetical protein
VAEIRIGLAELLGLQHAMAEQVVPVGVSRGAIHDGLHLGGGFQIPACLVVRERFRRVRARRGARRGQQPGDNDDALAKRHLPPCRLKSTVTMTVRG